MKPMTRYDPDKPPDPDTWFRLDEAERINLAEQYHRRARVRLPNVRLHATLHVIVENQVALGHELPVRKTLDRLQAEGLTRHDAIHAIGSVLTNQVYHLMKGDAQPDNPNAQYWADLEQLSAEEWRRAL